MVGIGGLLLFHGAGGDRDHRLFLALDGALAERGIPVARCNFPYRDKGPGRRPPDRMPKLIDSIRLQASQCAQAWQVDPGTLVFGGRSMGGRAASLAVAEGLPAAGLLLLSYPLHPPGKPDTLRVEHFPSLDVPVLLVQGRSDPFGGELEFAPHLAAIPGPVRQLWLERTGHDPVAKHDDAVLIEVIAWLDDLAGLSRLESTNRARDPLG